MKKTVSFVIVLSLLLISVHVIADNQVETITFRDIPWLEKRSTVKKTMSQVDRIKNGMYNSTLADIYSWYMISKYRGDCKAVEGGALLSYTNLDVAGYKADLSLSFMFPVENGIIVYSAADAQFYKATYIITNYGNYPAIFDDLATKLSSLYGEPVVKGEHNSARDIDDPKGLLWTAKDGSLVWLSMYYGSGGKYNEVWITYAAPDTEQMFMKFQNAVDEAEEKERIENQQNTEGL